MSDTLSTLDPTDRGPLHVLLVEDNPGDAQLVRELLREGECAIDLQWKETLEGGLQGLQEDPDVLILDLGLPDSRRGETVEQVVGAAPQRPVVVLTGEKGHQTALSALEHGATEYLRKEELTPSLLTRTLQWAVERKHVEVQSEKRKRRERVLSQALEQADDPVLITEGSSSAEGDASDDAPPSPGREILYVNAAFEDMTGYDEAELLGRTPGLLQGPETDEAVIRSLDEALSAGETWQGETVNYRKDGTPYIAQWNVSPVRGPEGDIECWVSIQRDVTEDRRREETLRRRQEQTQRLVGSWSIDLSTGAVQWSDQAYQLHEVETGTDVDLEDMLSFYVDEDRSTIRRAVDTCVEDGESFELEALLETEEGDRRWVRLVGAPVQDDSGRITSVAGAIRDLTAQKEAEELLRHQEAQLRGLAHSIPGVVYQFYARPDGEYGHYFVSERTETILGIAPDPEDYFERFIDHIPPPAREALLEEVDRVVEEQERFHFEIPFDRPDGERIWLQAVATPEERADEMVFNGVLLDVTARKNYEQALRAERDRFETLFESLPTPVVYGRLDDEHIQVEEVNSTFEQVFGRDRSRVAGENLLDVVVPTDDQEEADRLRRQILDGERVDCEIQREAADGSRHFRLQTALREGQPGEKTELYAIYTDITDRKTWERALQQEQKALRSLYRITADQEAEFEEKIDQLIELGRAYLDMPYGFLTRIEEGRQHIQRAAGTHRLLQNGASCPLSESYCRKTIQNKSLLAVQNAPDEGWDGDPAYEKFDLGSYIGSQVQVDGKLHGTFCFADTDPRPEAFSERERTFVELLTLWANYELEQRRAEEQLRRQNERLDNFASVVTHDLRNPLNVATGRLSLAREETDSDHLAAVARSLDRMGEIIEDVLTLTWGQQEIEAGDLDTCSLAEMATACWDQVAAAEATLAVDDPPRIRAEEGRLRRVLENLFRNAIEHARADVTVRVGALDRGFFVEDDGPGIPEEKRDEVLEAGFTSSEEGTGLGLSIVSTVAETHDWTVTVTESSEGGARFEFTGVDRPE